MVEMTTGMHLPRRRVTCDGSSKALLRRATQALLVGVGLMGAVLVCSIVAHRVPGEAIEVARRFAVEQKAGASEVGHALTLGDAVSQARANSFACVVFAAGPEDARVGVILESRAEGWNGWFQRASLGSDLECDRMLQEVRLLNTNLAPYADEYERRKR